VNRNAVGTRSCSFVAGLDADTLARALFLSKNPDSAAAWDGASRGDIGTGGWYERADAILAILACVASPAPASGDVTQEAWERLCAASGTMLDSDRDLAFEVLSPYFAASPAPPALDERTALIALVEPRMRCEFQTFGGPAPTCPQWGPERCTEHGHEAIADAVLAAGFRRPAPPVPAVDEDCRIIERSDPDGTWEECAAHGSYLPCEGRDPGAADDPGDPAAWPTPAQWIRRFLDLDADARLDRAARYIELAQADEARQMAALDQRPAPPVDTEALAVLDALVEAASDARSQHAWLVEQSKDGDRDYLIRAVAHEDAAKPLVDLIDRLAALRSTAPALDTE
jgi:hypothetical protein